MKLFGGDLDNAEALILAIEKSNPGSIAETDLEKEASELLRRRRLADFIERGVSPGNLKVTELAAALLSEKPEPIPVVALGPKLPLSISDVPTPPISTAQTEIEETSTLSDPEFIQAPSGGLPMRLQISSLREIQDPMEAVSMQLYTTECSYLC